MDAGNQRGLRRVRGGHDHALRTGPRDGVDERECSCHRSYRTVETELTEHGHAVEHTFGQTTVGARERERDRELEPRAGFANRRGARFTVTRLIGNASPDDSNAARTRSRDSRPAASGRPTTV